MELISIFSVELGGPSELTEMRNYLYDRDGHMNAQGYTYPDGRKVSRDGIIINWGTSNVHFDDFKEAMKFIKLMYGGK